MGRHKKIQMEMLLFKNFLELSIDEINKAFNEAFNSMSEKEKQKLLNEASVYDYITPKLGR